MIRYTLKCDKDHSFDSWFQSSDAYAALQDAGLVTCAVCGSAKVTKAIMAPRVSLKGASEAKPETKPDTKADVPVAGALRTPASPVETAMKELKAKIEANSDYVGKDFANEARRIHDGDAPERSIYGEAKPEEAKALIEEGVKVMPLPFLDKSKAN